MVTSDKKTLGDIKPTPIDALKSIITSINVNIISYHEIVYYTQIAQEKTSLEKLI